MPIQRAPRPRPVLASALAAAGLLLAVAGCSHVTPLGPDAAATTPQPHQLRSPFILQAMRVQPPRPAGGCPAGYAALPGANPGQCYRKTGTPVTITSAAFSAAPARPPGQQAGSAPYGFTVILPAGDVAALTTVTTTAYKAHGALAISAAGRTWALSMVDVPFTSPQLEIQLSSRSQTLELRRTLASAG